MIVRFDMIPFSQGIEVADEKFRSFSNGVS